MATPEANLPTSRPSDVVRSLNNGISPNRSSQNFNAFQLVSQLVSATPPYLFNMTSPFPGNFFSDLLRRMAPRAGTPSLSLDATLQQHIRAALLTKSNPHPVIPPTHLQQQMDLAALASQRHNIGTSPEKGLKRSLFSDVTANSVRDEAIHKRPRLDETREDIRKSLSDGLTSPFLLQSPFLPPVQPNPELISHWNSNSSLIRPQLPLPTPVSAGPFDPYRLLLDLRLAGQLHTMAATQAIHHKDSIIAHNPIPHQPIPQQTNRSASPPREMKPKEEINIGLGFSQNGTLRVDDSRVSAFHPPGRIPEAADEQGEIRSTSSNSNSSCNSASRESLGPQYIFKHLNEIYRSIDHQKPDGIEDNDGPTDSTEHKKTHEVVNAAYNMKREKKPDDFQHQFSLGPTHPRPIFPNMNGYTDPPGNFKANITIKSSEISEQSLDRV